MAPQQAARHRGTQAVEQEEIDHAESSEEEVTEAGAVEFGGDEEPKKLTGRRAKKEREARKRLKAGSFDAMGLSMPVLNAIKRKGFRLPTPIQRRALPLILQGVDVIGMARTGSGKTAAFVIPMVEKLKSHSPKAGARALLLAPTRELALQTHKAVRELIRYTDLRTAVLVGGDALEAQFAELANNPDVIVATPGRLLHHLAEVQGMSLRTVEYCVLDEADRLFEMGFAEQVRDILAKMSNTRQTLLFSATLPRSLADFAAAGLNAPRLVRLDTERRMSPDLKQLFFTVSQEDKMAALMHLVRETLPADQLTIMFVATRHHAEYVHNLMTREAIPAACVFGSMDQTARKIHIAKFRSKKVCLLITTDVAARGIDIPLIDNVINLDFPAKPELFIHRVGRAARMGRPGTAFSLLTRDELPYLLDLQLFLGRQVAPAPVTPSASQLQQSSGDPEAPAMYGSFPAPLISPQAEKLRMVESSAQELSGASRTLSNAFALYLRTRPAASTESVNRAKLLPKEGPHPVLLAQLPALHHMDLEAEAQLATFTASLRSFRPAATVLEAEIAAVKASHTSGPLLDAHALKHRSNDVMQRKRAAHSCTIEKERLKRVRAAEELAPTPTAQPSEPADSRQPASYQAELARQAAVSAMTFGDGVLGEGKYRDPGLYIRNARDPNTADDDAFQLDRTAAELQSAVLDLTAEDQEGMQSQQRRFHWDKRKKNYVQLQGVAASAGQAASRVKTESGATALRKGGGQGLYQKWVRSQHKRVAAAGSMEDSGPQSTDLANRFHPSMKHSKWRSENGNEKGQELRNKSQVRKERALKEKRKERLQQKRNPGSGRNKPASAEAGGVKKRRSVSGSSQQTGRKAGYRKGRKA